jgi:Lon protease-like protein
MASNKIYKSSPELPPTIPVFPLPGALLLPRGQLPLNIFEPRYLAMIDDSLKGERMIGMIQPDDPDAQAGHPSLYKTGCAGRLTQFSETGDGRYMISLTGISRFRLVEELNVTTPYRQCRVDFAAFAGDLTPNAGADQVDRESLLRTLAAYLKANKIEADWAGIEDAPTEALVNGLCMMAPYGAREKQALLEAPDLKARADILVAVTEISLAENKGNGEKPLQ